MSPPRDPGRTLSVDHASGGPAGHNVFPDAEASRLTGSHDDDEPDEARIRTWYGTRQEQDDRLDLAVVEQATGNVIGEAVLNEWNPVNESRSFRICQVPGTYGRGLGTESTRLVVGYGFESSSPKAYYATLCTGRASGWTRR